MASLNILQFPDERLKKKAERVSEINSDTKKIVKDMFETLYHANGVGLAATQVDIHQRIIVIDVSNERNQPVCLINPEIIDRKGSIVWDEGCLSFPGIWAKVKRSEEVAIRYTDEHGEPQTLEADDLLAVCIQHEIDHLDGITFYDHLSPLKQKLLRKKLEKVRKRTF